MPDLQLRGKVIITGYIKAKTGLHIGGSQGRVDIGGVDHLVIKDPEGKPYIPGSSLKGKLRSRWMWITSPACSLMVWATVEREL